MHDLYVVLLLVLPGLAVLNALWFSSELRRFLAEVPRLESTRDVELFKAVVARQMRAALVQIVLLGAPLVVFGVGIVRRVLGPGDLLYVILPALVVLAVAARCRPAEQAARSLPAADDVLTRERDRVVQTWLKKPLPDW
jgi:hypothetical protein